MEKDLFQPIKEYFEEFGYTCDGEVKDIDLYMEKVDDAGTTKSVAVELKQTLDFKSVQQAALRQKVTNTVFIGIFRPNDIGSRSFKDKLYILKRLGIGLIVVSKKTGLLEIVSEPIVSELSVYQASNKNKKAVISSEFQKRKVKSNTGGVHGTKLITSYREDALLVLDAMAEIGEPAKISQIKKISGIEKAASILQNNYYGWFEKTERGIYGLRDEGYNALEEFEDVLCKLRKN